LKFSDGLKFFIEKMNGLGTEIPGTYGKYFDCFRLLQLAELGGYGIL
jgi:hypothetical protein